jgi:hypothetical protein
MVARFATNLLIASGILSLGNAFVPSSRTLIVPTKGYRLTSSGFNKVSVASRIGSDLHMSDSAALESQPERRSIFQKVRDEINE